MLQDGLTIQRLMGSMKKLNASDLHIKVGAAPTFRVNAKLKPINCVPLDADDAERLLTPLLTDSLKRRFEVDGNLDFATHTADGERFRVALFRSAEQVHAAIRRVKSDIPTYERLHLPPIYNRLIEETHEGLVIVAGVTGSGKSSTLAAMIEHINATRAENIITIEDPVEYHFIPKKCIVSQREIGVDVMDYATALRYIVRQDPDVIFIGEIRDADTVLAAIQAAETGHLVFGALHTADTMTAMSRMLEFFPPKDHGFIRSAMANSLRAICAQRLLPAVDGFDSGLVPATEVLLGTAQVREKIREGMDVDLPAIIAGNAMRNPWEGTHTFTQSLAMLVNNEWTDKVTAMDHAPNPEGLDSALKGLKLKVETLVNRIRAARE